MSEKTLKEHGDKLPDDQRKTIDEALEELRKVKDSEDVEEIRQKMEAAQTASHQLAEIIYQQSKAEQAGGQAEQPEPQPEEDDNVVDADFEVKE